MANMNIFGKDWMDMIFKGRNKEYGAYELRKKSGKHTFLAMILGFLFIGLAFGSKYAYDQFGDLIANTQKDNDETIEVIEVMPFEEVEPPVDEIIEEPEPPEPVEPEGASKSVQDELEFKEVEVKEDDKVKNELKTSQDDFDENTTSGQLDQKGDKDDGDLKNEDNAKTGNASKGSKGDDRSDTFTEEPDNKIYRVTSQKAEPKNGIDGFYKEFQRKFRNLDIPSNVKTVSIRLKFVVEKDGSLSSIKALDNKYGVGDEAIRVLKSMPKWTPAQHNGKTVRSSFSLPIKMQVN